METTIDLHGMTVLEAKKTLEKALAKCPPSIDRIIVIHGYSSGDAIRNMVRDPNGVRSRKILRRKITKNPGETIFELTHS